MRVLIIGSGGREHALAWAMAKSENVTEVYVAPGNGGTAREKKCTNIKIQPTDTQKLVEFAQSHQVSLTVVGPEIALMAGVVDAFQAANLACFGPQKSAAILEGSKSFAKNFMKKYGIPTAEYQTFENITEAKAFVAQHGTPIVIKADGLAAGKGVVVAHSLEVAYAAIEDILGQKKFGSAGQQIVIESFLTGEELSFIALVDDHTIIPLASAQDHKARDAGDQGPNTGGMGAYSPAPILNDTLSQIIMERVMKPTVDGMAKEGRPFKGFLYAGLMISPTGEVKVLEFNCRMGDPETQPILMRLESDLAELIEAACHNRLQEKKITWDRRHALGVVIASKGYPESFETGKSILLPTENADQKIFHAGTTYQNETLISQGGRVLCACGLGNNIEQAQSEAYALAKEIQLENAYYRLDIGYRAIKKQNT